MKCRNPNICSQAWNVLMENVTKPVQAPKAEEPTKPNNTDNKPLVENNSDKTEKNVEESVTKLSKRDKKNERRKKGNKVEKKDKQGTNGELPDVPKNTTKKRKRKCSEQGTCQV